MSPLLVLQREIAAGIMAPLSGRTPERRAAQAHMKPNARMTALERLDIYRRSYWYRILDALRDDFPGLCAITGTRAFRRMSEAYLTDSPSQSFTMRNLGSALERWLVSRPEYAGETFDLALDMVRLEWAHIEAFDGADEKPVGPEDLLELSAEMTFGLQPHVGLLELRYPVDDLRIDVQDLGRDAQGRRKARELSRRYKHLPARLMFLAVHRVEFEVYYRPLAEGEFRILQALREGLPLGAAIGSTAEPSSSIEAWFTSWSQMGWLCPRQSFPGGKKDEG